MKKIVIFSCIMFFTYVFAFCEDLLDDSNTPLDEDGTLEIEKSIISDKISFYKKRGMKVISSSTSTNILGFGDYVIIKKYTVAQGAQLVLNPGAHIFLEDNASIDVYGELISKGTVHDKVFLTNLPANKHYLPPIGKKSKWNGIYVKDSGGVSLENCSILNCENSIVASKRCNYLSFKSVTFRNTGDYHLWFNNKPTIYDNNKCIDFSYKIETIENTIVEEKKVEKPIKKKRPKRKRSPTKIITMSVFGAAAVGCLSAAAVFNRRMNNYYDMANTDKNPDAADRYARKYKGALKNTNLCLIALGSCVGCVGITFVIPFKGRGE